MITVTVTDSEELVADRLLTLGYKLVWSMDSNWWLRDVVTRQHFAGPFKSIFSAASYMAPITHDDKLRQMVSEL